MIFAFDFQLKSIHSYAFNIILKSIKFEFLKNKDDYSLGHYASSQDRRLNKRILNNYLQQK